MALLSMSSNDHLKVHGLHRLLLTEHQMDGGPEININEQLEIVWIETHGLYEHFFW